MHELFLNMQQYVLDEWREKIKCDRKIYDLNFAPIFAEWRNNDNKNRYKKQKNGNDCGVWTGQAAKHTSNEIYPSFGHEEMTYFRQAQMIEILNGKVFGL